MPPKKKSETDTPETAPQTVVVRPKDRTEWSAMLERSRREHWRTIRVVIELTGRMFAGKPARLDAANIMLKARGLEDQIQAIPLDDPERRAQAAAAIVQDEGLCEFHRRFAPDGTKLPGIWLPANNVKAGLKENWTVCGYSQKERGSRGALAEGVFVVADQVDDRFMGAEELAVRRKAIDSGLIDEDDWIYLGPDPHGVEQRVAHTITPQGPRSSVKRHEFVERIYMSFRIRIANAVAHKLPDNALSEVMIHFGEHGVGACRSQGLGKFVVVELQDLVDSQVPSRLSA